MKQLNQYIVEKFKINSKTVKNQNGLNIDFDFDDCLFNNSDLNKIIAFIKELSPLPQKVVLSDSGKSIVLKYNYKQTKKDGFDKEGEFVRIFFMVEPDGYKIGFRKTLFDNVILYPSSTKGVNFDHISECFDCVKQEWSSWTSYIKEEK